MKKNANPFFLRLEFSDESGKPEGGDILNFSSLKEVQKIVSEILAVSAEDKVAVNLTVGRGDPFFGFLKSFGLSRKDAENEMVDLAAMSPKKGATKKKAATKAKTKKKKK